MFETRQLVAAPAVGSISAGTTNATLGGISFVNSNGITFGLSSNSITASFSAGTAGNSLNVSAGTQSSNLTQLVFADSNGVTFGLSNGTITASASGGTGGAADVTLRQWEPAQMNNALTWSRHIDATQGVIVFDPMPLPCALSFNTVRLINSASNLWGSSNYSLPGSASWYIDLGMYSRSVTDSAATNFSNSSVVVLYSSTRWSMMASLSQSSLSKSWTFNWVTDATGGLGSLSSTSNGAQIQIPGLSGRIVMQIPFGLSLSAGDWWIGKRYDITTVGNNPGAVWFSSVGILTWASNTVNLSFIGDTGTNDPGYDLILSGLGQYTVTSASLPSSANFISDIQNNPSSQQRRWYAFVA